MNKSEQKKHITDIIKADEKDGLYDNKKDITELKLRIAELLKEYDFDANINFINDIPNNKLCRVDDAWIKLTIVATKNNSDE